MGRRFRFVARLTTAGLLAVAVLVLARPAPGIVSARSSGCPAASTQRPPADGTAKCYGSRPLTFRAYVQYPCTDGCGGTLAYTISPRWFDSLDGSYVELGTGPRSARISVFVPPRLGRCSEFAALRSCPLRPGQWAIVTARFNHPLARTCRYADHPPGPGFSRKEAIAECSADLVVDSVVPVAPETDVAAAVEDPAGNREVLPLLAFFVAALVLAARWLPRRERALELDRSQT
jgi:hypothetical protein